MTAQAITTVWRNCAPSGIFRSFPGVSCRQLRALKQDMRWLATTKSAHPETPLHYYKATSYATASINHRAFYINWIAMIFLLDVCSGTLDF
ncbi:hypothetical protein IE077_000551 [Cardiosporidium cionae]|uniref:Uncharacterized protein n=1 Tax=Cardiosporidium cionae TaxID=476202 RepID=A0ABQ7J864_9APIC|nr:hypothetical protein IE077_000551 [Cardiosporidium cionae]|eukprot:KAF8820183.1 hypothetical protein IE077_000551 [Cardiosporidium cionae]